MRVAITVPLVLACVPAWAAVPGTSVSLSFSATTKAEHPQTVNLVIVDAASGRPVQAVRLGAC